MILRHPLTRNIGIGAPSDKGAGAGPLDFIGMAAAQKAGNRPYLRDSGRPEMTNPPPINRLIDPPSDAPNGPRLH